jgi:chromosome segregation ATPase
MKKLVTIAAILVLVGLVVANKHNVKKMIGCPLSQMCCKQNAPEDEIQKLQDEITQLDSQMDTLIKEEARLHVDIKALKAKIPAKEKAFGTAKESLVGFAQAVKENKGKGFEFTNHTYTLVSAQKKLEKDFQLYNSLEAELKSLKNSLTAKEKHYNTLVDQRKNLVTTKLTFQATLDKLSADWAQLKSETSASTPGTDANKLKEIQASLDKLAYEIQVKTEEHTIRNEIAGTPGTPQIEPPSDINADAVLSKIQGNEQKNNTQTVKTPE